STSLKRSSSTSEQDSPTRTHWVACRRAHLGEPGTPGAATLVVAGLRARLLWGLSARWLSNSFSRPSRRSYPCPGRPWRMHRPVNTLTLQLWEGRNMAWFRKKMWLDVEGGWAGWIDTPNSGADASPTGWGTEATLLNGGGYAANSWGTHKRYTLEWSDASSRQAAPLIQPPRSGAHATGLIPFIEPTP